MTTERTDRESYARLPEGPAGGEPPRPEPLDWHARDAAAATRAADGRMSDATPVRPSLESAPTRQRRGKIPVPLQIRFDEKWMPEPNSGCWLWLAALNKNGYGAILATARSSLASRASWALHRGPIPTGLHVLHKCDVRCCVNPDHLFLGTQADNLADMDRKGRRKSGSLRGDRHHQAKLKTDDVLKIREAGGSPTVVAQSYGVSRTTIGDILAGRSWRHLKRDLADARVEEGR